MTPPAPSAKPSRPAQAFCVRVRLKPDSLAQVQQWAAHVAAHRAQALQSLASEGVDIESVFLGSDDQGDHLIYYMRSASLAHAQRVAAESVLAIDAYHQNFKRSCWASVEPLTCVLDLAAAPHALATDSTPLASLAPHAPSDC